MNTPRQVSAAASLWILMLGCIGAIGCGEIPTSAQLGRGPAFLLDGNGKLASFRVYGPQAGHKIATPFNANELVWEIHASAGYFQGASVRHLLIEFGGIPSGYTQSVPVGAAKIAPHLVYYFLAETANAPPAAGFFYLDGDVPIEIDVPDLCETGVTGDVKPIKCSTKVPYEEPPDLEEFVRKNRLEK